MRTFYLITFMMLMSLGSRSDTDIIMSLSNGSCWIENSEESFKVASFNESWTQTFSKEKIQSKLIDLFLLGNVNEKIQSIKSMHLSLHCGGYGSSIVSLIQTDWGDFCMWSKYIAGEFSVRSIGIVPKNFKVNNQNCQGVAIGELLITVRDTKSIEKLKSIEWSKIIRDISYIAGASYKINLTKDFLFKEEEVKQLILNQLPKSDIEFVEFNEFNHPIGEFFILK